MFSTTITAWIVKLANYPIWRQPCQITMQPPLLDDADARFVFRQEHVELLRPSRVWVTVRLMHAHDVEKHRCKL